MGNLTGGGTALVMRTPDPAPGDRISLIALAARQQNITARLRDSGRRVTFRPQSRIWEVVEGETVTVAVDRTWTFGRTRYVSGSIESVHLDVTAWGLLPLALTPVGEWDPGDYAEAVGDAPAPVARYLRAIMQLGPRPAFEMEQVLPGADSDDPDSDPIIAALDARDMGDPDSAFELLQSCLVQDLRCIDAHVHLGHLHFGHGTSEWTARNALRHYSVGVAVGEQALGPDFNGVLPWGWINNRPFLRSLQGLGLAAWQLGGHETARRVMERLLWLDPSDPMGTMARLAHVRAGKPYVATR